MYNHTVTYYSPHFSELEQADIYQRSLASVNELQDTFGRLWTQCQRCQGSLHQDVLCTARDCPIFYRSAPICPPPCSNSIALRLLFTSRGLLHSSLQWRTMQKRISVPLAAGVT